MAATIDVTTEIVREYDFRAPEDLNLYGSPTDLATNDVWLQFLGYGNDQNATLPLGDENDWTQIVNAYTTAYGDMTTQINARVADVEDEDPVTMYWQTGARLQGRHNTGMLMVHLKGVDYELGNIVEDTQFLSNIEDGDTFSPFGAYNIQSGDAVFVFGTFDNIRNGASGAVESIAFDTGDYTKVGEAYSTVEALLNTMLYAFVATEDLAFHSPELTMTCENASGNDGGWVTLVIVPRSTSQGPLSVGRFGDALQSWIQENEGSVTSHELVGMLNELNGTTGVGEDLARRTYQGLE